MRQVLVHRTTAATTTHVKFSCKRRRIRHRQCHNEWYLHTIPTVVMPIEFQPESIVEGERFQMTIFKRRDRESVKQEFKEN